ncbi:MAG: 16S rRNA (cytidine(1402)-2'-O)-methyltransferase [Thermovirgaceae bacterium]|jgi:16S rRNA (cytidine1402-2'-O)-methyltransferase|nr:16S rRNA (cytidine(1402)-2'-O)-methyltransferase [Synergistales bacterium]MDI9392619.1 16S rRNA (cytidine(1402)-2'-O)-methyltransferase [Synergistota bacterium]NLV65237.1 16S rRNA (cytidine(1402)-2'-O)-methyltransferase [Synergistaceae bacterium]HRW87769.1 16S rRNA (cytidine(1402)-2'-O)-methyltransferase [Thermovirgaceae bacterium]MDD3134481.1 16S rRNA (cytidine(1402)-2'-O)-methyltransferase [Synergistales bacterium]
MPLVVIPTPVGNMEDITLRALRALRGADLIACEDTRRTMKILSRYGIRTPLVSYHSFNEKERTRTLTERLSRGDTVALVSDAGTPGISDPGYELIRSSLEEGFEVDVLPGATAFVPALLLSGFPPQPFLFEGFLSRRKGDRRRRLEELKSFTGSIVFYLSPHGPVKILEDIHQVLGERPAVILREISKLHQERIPGSLASLQVLLGEASLKGEMVLVTGPPPRRTEPESSGWQEMALGLCEQDLPDKEVVKRLSEEYGIAKNKIKQFLHSKRREKEGL